MCTCILHKSWIVVLYTHHILRFSSFQDGFEHLIGKIATLIYPADIILQNVHTQLDQRWKLFMLRKGRSLSARIDSSAITVRLCVFYHDCNGVIVRFHFALFILKAIAISNVWIGIGR